MDVVKMRGGLGNQMFQYAFGKVISLQRGQVTYDLSWYVDHRTIHAPHPRPFRLGCFQVTTLVSGLFSTSNSMVYEKRVGFNPKIFELKNFNNFDGYWQYYPYYENIVPILRKEFQLRTEHYTEEFLKMAETILDSNSVSVHIRRGDYLLQREGGFGELPVRYQFSAIKEVEGDLFIFSDDMPWCRRIFLPQYFNRKITFVDMEDYLCFELMRLCKHNIITNSTFSWWAALMNENPNKKVICPIHYLGENPEHSAQYRYPREWIKMEDYL